MFQFDVSILVTIMKVFALLFLIIFIVSAGYYSLVHRDANLREQRLSLRASLAIGVLIFFIPLIIHGGEQTNISWGFWVDIIQPFSLFGLLFFGMTGFITIYGIIKLVQRAYRSRTLTVNKLVTLTSKQSDGQTETQTLFTFDFPPKWVNTPQFLVACFTGISFILLFYFLFGDETTSRGATIFTFGMFIGALVHIMRLSGNKLSALLWTEDR